LQYYVKCAKIKVDVVDCNEQENFKILKEKETEIMELALRLELTKAEAMARRLRNETWETAYSRMKRAESIKEKEEAITKAVVVTVLTAMGTTAFAAKNHTAIEAEVQRIVSTQHTSLTNVEPQEAVQLPEVELSEVAEAVEMVADKVTKAEAEAQVAEAQVAEAQVAEAQVAEVQVAEAQVAEAQVAETQAVESQAGIASSYYNMTLTASELDFLEKLVFSESGNQPDLGQILVANAVLNRAKVSGQSVVQVGCASGQFSPVKNGVPCVRRNGKWIPVTEEMLTGQLKSNVRKALEKDYSIELLQEVAMQKGITDPRYWEGGAKYFYNPNACSDEQNAARSSVKVEITIADHNFYAIWG